MSIIDQFVPGICAGDHDAFASWLAGAEPRIRLSLSSFATRVDTESVLQESLLRIWQIAPRFESDGRPDGLVRLAIRIARNFAITELRRCGHDVNLDEIEGVLDEITVPSVETDPLLREAIQDCRDALPARPREAFDARQQETGLPDRDLAERLGMKLNTFLKNVGRAYEHLRKCLERRGITPGGEA